MSLEEVHQHIGEVKEKAPSRPLNILWLYGYDKYHIPGAHDYVKIKNLMVSLLKTIPKVTVDEAYQFPTKEQFSKADLIVSYLHFNQFKNHHFEQLNNYIQQGGGFVALHESVIIRPSNQGKKLSQCFGCAWHEGKSKWGAIFDDIHLDTQHPIFKNFPNKLTLHDEFYWDLYQEKDISILASVRTGQAGNSKSPTPKNKLSKTSQAIIWTYELGKGRVFATSAGHNTFTYYDPEFRIILFRAMAWTLREKPDPFMPLVTKGITINKQVGTTSTMRHWKGKKR